MKYYLPLVGIVEACTFRAPVPTERYEERKRKATGGDAVHLTVCGGRAKGLEYDSESQPRDRR